MTHLIGIRLAGISLNCIFQNKECIPFFKKFEVPPGTEYACVQLCPEDLALMKRDYPVSQWGPVAELKLMTPLVSDALLPYDRMIFHSVAFIFRNRAWLLTAPSGTGKTTQYLNLVRMYPGEIQILCGDNPVLHFQENGSVMVFPSPWNGKERYGSDKNAELAGIILLEQAASNMIELMQPKESVLPVFHQINTFLKTEAQVHKLFYLEKRLIQNVPVWRFKNTGDMDSSELLFRHIRAVSST